MDLVIGIDPGYTTGVCVLSFDADHVTGVVIESRQLVWNDRFELLPLIVQYLPKKDTLTLHVVVEDFRLYGHKAQDQINNSFPSVNVIGVLDLVAHLNSIHLNMQMASMISKVAVLPEHLPYLIKSEHTRDAYKHARYHAIVRLRYIHVSSPGLPAQSS